MELFISWSGDTSQKLARALHEWLPDVIQRLRPWASSEDISKGKRWNEDLSKTLDRISESIICVTPSNMGSHWLNFEAGALAKRLTGSGGQVRPVLLGMRPADIVGPLASFQATEVTNQEDVRKLIHSLNRPEKDHPALTENRLNRYFDAFWPALEKKVAEISFDWEGSGDAANENAPQERNERDMLAELVETVRRLERDADYRSKEEVRRRGYVNNLTVGPVQASIPANLPSGSVTAQDIAKLMNRPPDTPSDRALKFDFRAFPGTAQSLSEEFRLTPKATEIPVTLRFDSTTTPTSVSFIEQSSEESDDSEEKY